MFYLFIIQLKIVYICYEVIKCTSIMLLILLALFVSIFLNFNFRLVCYKFYQI